MGGMILNISQKIGKNVHNRRKKLQMSQEELAFHCQISTKYLGQIERGEANPSIKVLDQISNSLNTSISNLIKN